MSLFHKHNWKEIARTYAPSIPEQGGGRGNGWTDAMVQGQTTILWECSECQDLRKEEMLGKLLPTK